MDGKTLARLNTFSPGDVRMVRIYALSFSPDSRLLTALHDMNLTSWDLQTGGCIGTSTLPTSHVTPHDLHYVISCTHSVDGKTIAVASQGDHSWTISTFNILSGTQTYFHRSSTSGGHMATPIWTEGERLRFAVVGERSIVIQESGFASSAVLREVESFPPPPYPIGYPNGTVFLPSLSRIAFHSPRDILVWDCRRSKILLKQRHDYHDLEMTFSSDGQFFAATTSNDNIPLWKDSPAGYVLHQKFPLVSHLCVPTLSPDGESIIIYNMDSIQLWPTRGQLVHFPVPVGRNRFNIFFLEFSPDGALAAAAAPNDWNFKVTVLDLKSGDPRLVLDVNGWVTGLGLTESSVVVVSKNKITTWNIPSGGRSLSEKRKILRSPQTEVHLDIPGDFSTMSVSPSLSHIAVFGYSGLWVVDGFTGDIACSTTSKPGPSWFTQDGCEIWSMDDESIREGRNSSRGWKLIEDNESGSTKLEPLGPTVHPSGGFPWISRHGHEVTPDGWVRNSSGKLLLWLPGQWRSNRVEDIIWHGQFVGLLRAELPEPVILELSE